jgi:hypothetical protein
VYRREKADARQGARLFGLRSNFFFAMGPFSGTLNKESAQEGPWYIDDR